MTANNHKPDQMIFLYTLKDLKSNLANYWLLRAKNHTRIPHNNKTFYFVNIYYAISYIPNSPDMIYRNPEDDPLKQATVAGQITFSQEEIFSRTVTRRGP